MKFALTTILIGILLALGYGFYIKGNGDMNGEIVIGIAVLALAFIWMPLFIYHRYKNKDLRSFKLRNFESGEDKPEI